MEPMNLEGKLKEWEKHATILKEQKENEAIAEIAKYLNKKRDDTDKLQRNVGIVFVTFTLIGYIITFTLYNYFPNPLLINLSIILPFSFWLLLWIFALVGFVKGK